jgi:hypothetical protein
VLHPIRDLVGNVPGVAGGSGYSQAPISLASGEMKAPAGLSLRDRAHCCQASWIATTRNQANHVARRGWDRSMIVHAF